MKHPENKETNETLTYLLRCKSILFTVDFIADDLHFNLRAQ